MIIGYKGNLGGNIAKKLSHHELVLIGREEFSNLEFYLKDVELVIHAAGNIFVSLDSDPVEFIESNIASCAKVLELIKVAGVRSFIYISSSAVYGLNASTSENSGFNPSTTNGDAKSLCEKMIIGFCSKNNILFNILRVFNMYGGKDYYSIISKIITTAKGETTFRLINNGELRRDFVHVEDVADVVKTVAQNEVKAQVLNVGTGHGEKIIDLINYAKSFSNVETVPTMVPLSYDCVANVERLREYINIDGFISVYDYLKSELSEL